DLRCLYFFFSTGKESLDDVKRYRDKEDCDCGSGDHAADHSRTEYAPGDCPRTTGKPKRQHSENKCKGSHQDRAQAQARASERRIEERFPFLVFVLGDFDNM